MLLGHAPLLIRRLGDVVVGQPTDPVAIGTLVVASAFFLLKAIDTPVLRFTASRRSWMALTLLVALLHADVARHGETDGPHGHAIVLIAGVAGSVLVIALRRTLRRLRGSTLLAGFIAPPLRRAPIRPVLLSCHSQTLRRRPAPPRAPPSVALS